MRFLLAACVLALFPAIGCGDDDGDMTMTDAGPMDDDADMPMPDAGDGLDAGPDAGADVMPTRYEFESRFVDGESSVSHGGQTTRQVLVQDLVAEMKTISEGILGGTFDATMVDEEGEVTARLNAILRGTSADLGTRPLPGLLEDGDTLCEPTYADLSDSNLIDKIAGQDDATDHMDWDGDDAGSTGPAFVGWSDATGLTVPTDGTVATPVGLIDTFIATFEAQVRACIVSVDNCPEDPAGDPLPLYVTPDGRHLAQLVEKFLFGALNFSQLTDDYLDDEPEDTTKGLLVDNTMPRDEGATSTQLEHHWDEGWGYFGAAVDYGDYTDEEIAGAGGRPEYANGYHDLDGDACISVGREFNFDLAGYAAKRDEGSMSPTDFTAAAFDALLMGRWLISQGASLDDIRAQRDLAVAAIDQVFAANVIHYINETIADAAACGGAEFSFEDYAEHWSELKAFALGLQFNPRSPVHEGSFDFAAMHTAIGDAPVLCSGDVAGYQTTLTAVRADVQAAYGFADADVENW